jgi:RHS repeat-associated protein
MANNHATVAALVASYRYDPFGRIFYQSGTLASANVYRFSSKAQMPNSGLYYYRFRFYDPLTQRWLNRDPIAERGGVNLYAFAQNDSVNEIDLFGEMPASSDVCKALKRKIENLEKEVAKRHRELYEDPLGLPGKAPGDDKKPSLSRRGHQRLLNERKAALAAAKALYQARCTDPEDSQLQQCWDAAVQAVPGTPQQLEAAGEISTFVGTAISAVVATKGLPPRGPRLSPSPRPVPAPAPSAPFLPVPQPAIP